MLNQKPILGSVVNWGHPLSKGLVGCWLLNEGAGGLINDSSNRNIYGHVVNADYTWSNEKFGSFVNFGTATQTYFMLDHDIRTLTYNQPSSLVIRCRGSGGTDRGLVGSNTGAAFLDYLEIREGFYIRHRYSSDVQTEFTSVTSFTDWHTFAITSDGVGNGANTLRLYQDGSFKEAQVNKNFMFTHLDRIGGAYSTDICSADISYVMFFNIELSSTVIGELYYDPFCIFKRKKVIISVPVSGIGMPIVMHHRKLLEVA